MILTNETVCVQLCSSGKLKANNDKVVDSIPPTEETTFYALLDQNMEAI
jgi:hypothetical protein